MTQTQDIQQIVKEKYGEAARRVTQGGAASSCRWRRGRAHQLLAAPPARWPAPTPSRATCTTRRPAGLPEAAVLASLGCGNPTALAELRAGEVVLDLGSGGGIDVLLSAKRVGPTGKAYGLDMTDEMLALARDNQRQAGATNVEF